MKRTVLCGLCLFLTLSIQAVERIDSLLAILKSNDSGYVFVVAHRGDWRHAPENSISAINSAAAMGVDMVEIDIQKTKDGDFVLMHDGNINRMTDGTGNISDYTVEELKKFRLRFNDGTLSDERIPTLKEALLACKGKLLVNIDKGGDYLADITPIIQETETENHVILKGRNAVEQVKKQLVGYKDIIYMPIVDLDSDGAISYIDSFLSDFHPVAMEVGFKTDDFPQLSYVNNIADAGCRIWINTLWESLCGGHEDEKAITQPDDNWGWVLKQRATIIQTDRPVELISYLKQKGLREIRSGIIKYAPEE